MKPNKVVLDGGSKNGASEWSCGKAIDVTTTTTTTTTVATTIIVNRPTKTTASTTTTTTREPEDPSRFRIPQNLECKNPAADESDRIINGLAAYKNSWPWIAYIKFGYGFCGGTILDNHTVITAAHCCRRYRNSPDQVTVVIGEHDKRWFDQGQEDIRVNSVIIHDDFKLATLDSDLCLLKTEDMNLSKSL